MWPFLFDKIVPEGVFSFKKITHDRKIIYIKYEKATIEFISVV